MTIDEFHQKIMGMALDRAGLKSYGPYLRQKKRPDKYLREEYLAIQAVVLHKKFSGDVEIELGNEKEAWDARIGRTELFEVVQALPAEEHVIRCAVASGKAEEMLPVEEPKDGEPAKMPLTGPLAQFLVQVQHACDHLQFPKVIVDAINQKHDTRYIDQRTLIVVFDGDYSFEEDKVVQAWVSEIRRRTTRGAFKEILLDVRFVNHSPALTALDKRGNL